MAQPDRQPGCNRNEGTLDGLVAALQGLDDENRSRKPDVESFTLEFGNGKEIHFVKV